MVSLVSYEGDKCNESAKTIADTIKNRLKHCGYDRYKYIVQVQEKSQLMWKLLVFYSFFFWKVLIGERREQGVRMGSRCFWDSNTDNQASEYVTNVSDNLFHFDIFSSTFFFTF